MVFVFAASCGHAEGVSRESEKDLQEAGTDQMSVSTAKLSEASHGKRC